MTEPRMLSGRRRLLLRLLLWGTLYAGLLSIYNHAYARLSPWLVGRLQLAPAAWILGSFFESGNVSHDDLTLTTPRVRMELKRGCDGVEAWIILMAAGLVMPMRWRRRLVGALAGSALIFGLNVARIVSLYHVALWRYEWFDVAHGMVWQSLMVVAAAAFVLAWMRPEPAK